MKLILASNSPRRREILTKMGIEFTVLPSFFDESKVKEKNSEVAEFFAINKAKDVFNRLEDKEGVVVLGADTIVCFENEVLGKPKDREDAKKMLKRLSGNTHKVITGYAFIGVGVEISGSEVSEVIFNDLSDEYIEKYVENANPLDKAGSYGIQDGYNLVKEYRGSFDNIVGLPSEKIGEVLKKFYKSVAKTDGCMI
ncbi:MAG: septum formation protein Maf [Clostridia bacterium]|nr:septum formation protein Maf [Clostridia bacterium]